MLRGSIDVQAYTSPAQVSLPLLGWGNSLTFSRGNKFFELTNLLGNVLAVISDKKLGISTDGSTVDHFNPQVVDAIDYYPFGSLEPGRIYEATTAGNYRYGFNGKENDNEVEGIGNEQDYGFRIYDPRAGRFLSLDPLTEKYPELTPYQFASNRPIDGIDQDGREHIKQFDQYEVDDNDFLAPLHALANVGVNFVNLATSLYNSGDDNVRSIRQGTWLKDTWNGIKGTGSSIRNATVSTYKYINTNTPLDALKSLGTGKGFQTTLSYFAFDGFSTEAKASDAVAARTTEKAADVVHGGTAEGAASNTATAVVKTETKTQQVLVNQTASKISEDIVREQLTKNLGKDEMLLEKPRIYIGDGTDIDDYSVPDFAIYNRETGEITDVVDAKNRSGNFTTPQLRLKELGGVFKRSRRYKNIKNKKVLPGMLRKINTNVK